ncbi:hypothetical protein LINPERHAP1_LOCUS30207, partial [Linum perenne]
MVKLYSTRMSMMAYTVYQYPPLPAHPHPWLSLVYGPQFMVGINVLLTPMNLSYA